MRSLLQIFALFTLSLSLGVSGAPAPESESVPAPVKSVDQVVNPQGVGVPHSDVEKWNTLKSQSVQFAYIKATAGTR